MAKKVAVIAVNPVNGSGLFQYLETFFENKISYKTFAVDTTKDIKTNSGISIHLDGVVADLKGKENEFDAVVFSCGDAMIPGAQNNEQAMGDALAVLAEFNKLNKLIAGHCASAIIFDKAGIATGKRLAVHPLGKAAIQKGTATDDAYTIDGNIYTAQCEHTIHLMLPDLLEGLR